MEPFIFNTQILQPPGPPGPSEPQDELTRYKNEALELRQKLSKMVGLVQQYKGKTETTIQEEQEKIKKIQSELIEEKKSALIV